jgi:hypothetical protein
MKRKAEKSAVVKAKSVTDVTARQKPKAVPASLSPALNKAASTNKGQKIMTESAKKNTEAKVEATLENTAEAAAASTMDSIKNTTAKVAEKATEAFTGFQARAKDAMASTGDIAKDVVAFHKSNFDAIATSGKIAAVSAQDAVKTTTAYGKKNWEATTAHAKAVAAVKSPAEFFELQRGFATKQLEAVAAELPKVSAFWMKFASDVAAPLQQRMVKASEEVQARLAA